ncbi:hypothetical protein LCGC14_0777950 [marine sediment metagenome]|uniref:Uncharacterized protein n=1 Tax=marine sediment metagenome TaxID=412755 RepID=A0A0F9T3F2_9ZZZZ|nr:hypothetical protein [Desulfobacterales bacterium]
MTKKAKYRKPINLKGMSLDPKRKPVPKPPPIDWESIPISGCSAMVGWWPLRRVCGHLFFHPLCNIKVIPGSQPVMFGLIASPFVVCAKCGVNTREPEAPKVDIKLSQFWEWFRYSLFRGQFKKKEGGSS